MKEGKIIFSMVSMSNQRIQQRARCVGWQLKTMHLVERVVMEGCEKN